jgi:hypothetical protein
LYQLLFHRLFCLFNPAQNLGLYRLQRKGTTLLCRPLQPRAGHWMQRTTTHQRPMLGMGEALAHM